MRDRSVTFYANPKQLFYVIGGGVIGLVLLVVLVRGLAVTPPPPPVSTGTARTVEDPWPQVSKDLERDTDVASCRRALDQLTLVLSANPQFDAPTGLTAADEKTLREWLPGFTDDDAKELRSTAFTKLDPHHLAESYYFRDAAKSLDVADRAPLDRAKRAFAFVCRQVYLNRWLLRIDKDRVQPMPAVPPSYVLRRGWGTGLERAMVFLALLRQLGLDGCLVGPPGSESKDGMYAPPEKAGVLDAVKGPFWAVGVRIGADVFLFEPWRGEPFPGPAETGVGTLARLKADPKSVAAWVADKENPWDVAAGDLAAGEVFLATPLSTLAPRMQRLEEKLTGAAGVRLFDDAAATRDRFLKEKATSQPPKWWSPSLAVDGFDVFHGMASFQPADEGGRDSSQGPSGRRMSYQASLLPPSLFVRAPELTSGEATDVLFRYIQGAYLSIFLTPPSPLERIQRGNYFDVSILLTRLERDFSQAVARYRTGQLPPPIKQFASDLNDLYSKLQRARTARDAGAEATLRSNIDAAWAKREPIGILVERGLSEPAEAEATYLLALCKHEAAERASGRAERVASAVRTTTADAKADPEKLKELRSQMAAAQVTATNAWKEANTWWQQYSTVRGIQDPSYPGRSVHAQKLAAEAAARAGGTG